MPDFVELSAMQVKSNHIRGGPKSAQRHCSNFTEIKPLALASSNFHLPLSPMVVVT